MMKLTERIVETLTCPAEKAEIMVPDDEVRGLFVRAYRSGQRVYVAQYRLGGRGSRQRRERLGLIGQISLSDARRAARALLGELAKGVDPVAERRQARLSTESRLDALLPRYEQHLARRRIVAQKLAISSLRRHLVEKLGGHTQVTELTRRVLAKRIDEVAAELPGASLELRKHLTGFLNWCVNKGYLPASPLAGLRRDRRSRAERLEEAGRVIGDVELAGLWQALATYEEPQFRDYVRLLLLLGVRRTELATARWSDIDPHRREWRIPAGNTKTGRARTVPLSQEAISIIEGLPRLVGTDLLLPGRDGRPMTGWSKRMPRLLRQTEACGVGPFRLHDLRRTFRTGLTRLSVPAELAELCIGHRRAALIETYDREPRLEEQRAAFEQWARHVLSLGASVRRLSRTAA
jgi:integrase